MERKYNHQRNFQKDQTIIIIFYQNSVFKFQILLKVIPFFILIQNI